YGFIPVSTVGSTDSVEIRHVSAIASDTKLKGQRVRVTLDKVRVAEYPGSGRHNVFLGLSAQSQSEQSSEGLHFNKGFVASEGQEISSLGFPIFIGLPVGLN